MPSDVDITLEPMAGLVREHYTINEAIEGARDAVLDAVRAPSDANLAQIAVESIRDLESFMDGRLALHIAKEEDILFPALRLDPEITTTIDELIEQHDEVRERHREMIAALAHLDEAHEEVNAERSRLSDALRAAGTTPSAEQMLELWETVRRLHWILQGHFGDEEDDLFLPAESLLSAEQLAQLQHRVDALEQEWQESGR